MPKNLGRYNDDLSVPRKQDLDSLETRIKTNEDDIAMAQSDIEGLDSDVGTLNTDVSAVKTALDSKQDTVVGGASTIVEDNLTADRALISNESGKVTASEVTSAELGYVSGVTSSIQTQIDSKAAQTALDGVRYQMAAKADQSAVDALRNQVNAKADSLALDNVLAGARISIFSTTSNYTTNEYVWNSNHLYQANEDISAGAWDETKWTEIVVVDELDKKYSADNPPPYPVTSVNTKTGEVTLTASDVNAVSATGNETISGTKTFSGAVKLNGGIDVKSNGNAILNVEGVSTTVDYIDVWVDGGTNKNRPLVLQTNSATTGNVGIGTATPSSKLEVKGNVKASSFSGDGSGLTNIPYPITSVNTKTGEVVLTATDVGALPDTTTIPTNNNQLTNGAGYITAAEAPIQSVNSKTGTVTLTASDVGALPATGGTMSGVLSAQSNTSYTTAQARNIIISTELPSGGQPGEIWIRYSD